MAISSRGCLIPRPLLPVPPDTEEAPGLPRLHAADDSFSCRRLSCDPRTAVHDLWAVCTQHDEQTSTMDGRHIHTANLPTSH
jgi:hypothetical protein